MNEKPLYRIVNWNLYFETYESRRLNNCTFVVMPNKHDGKSFGRAGRLKNAHAIYGAWTQIVQLASKMPIRGVLADFDGPLDAEDMADKTGFSREGFEKALAAYSDERIGWIEEVSEAEEREMLLAQVLTTGISRRDRRRPQLPADTRTHPQLPAEHELPIGHNADDAQQSKPAILPADTRTHPQLPADTRNFPQPPALKRTTRVRAGENRREGNRTEDPPTVPQGGPDVSDFQRRLNALFKRTRRWSQEEEYWLTGHAITADEIGLIERWFAAARSDQKYKLPESITTLMRDWPKNLDRSRAYVGEDKKEARPEPPGWEEATRAEFGDKVHLPPSFWDLEADVREAVEARLQEATINA